jgi:predicted transcriptional regulator
MFDTSLLLVPGSDRTGGGQVLVELSVLEQCYQAVLAVIQNDWKVTEVAARLGVSRQAVQQNRSRAMKPGGLHALEGRSHRPQSAHQITPEPRGP